MMVVEPFALSEPFSTSGKVNMNYQVAPFTYIERTTGLRAALKATMAMAIPTADANKYKAASGGTYRFHVNLDETLKQFDEHFRENKPFVSASEICDQELVPQGQTLAGMPAFWSQRLLTGDNSRETGYGHIYPLLTTKSNTYTVHVKVQTLKKVKGTPADEFVHGRDLSTGEFRGAFVIERYLDPNAASFDETDPGAYMGDANTPYRFRVLRSKQFAPGG